MKGEVKGEMREERRGGQGRRTTISRPRCDIVKKSSRLRLRFGRREVTAPIGPSREVSTSGDGLAPGMALEVTVMVMVRARVRVG